MKQFEYNDIRECSRMFIRNFFVTPTKGNWISSLLCDRIQYFDDARWLENFIQTKFVAVHAAFIDCECAFEARGDRLTGYAGNYL